ncbi:heavy metal translocating P-type ATPase [Helicobacter cappadocius]|uniref:Copper-transporting ATPase n=1 Tax=Helicobacter cappadocius TaxID=3063998 RepID=A0AA90TAY3_9HELI|nr:MULTISPECIES: heavy metal translocating P-type ATPase [unclassified Helicobacter]MDO7252444.1 heavy metal translocating P-type ATPase [Helicobacter sp. faydin-H75]MDP2538311.1 heavy metal translocating P-type ATPase [Helicobacter sp. faydin-H76]
MKNCSHCHLQYPESALKKYIDNGKELYFCCNGCEGVYFLLKESGLDGFYDKLGDNAISPPMSIRNHSLDSFDTLAFAEKYISTKDGLCEVCLILENIHCAACIWLNEKILNAQEGIYEVSINYTNNKARIVFDCSVIKLSRIIELIQSIGYDAYAYDPYIQEIKSKKERKNYYISMVIAIFCTMNIMWIAVAQYSGYFLGMGRDMKDVLNFVSFVLATPVLFYTGRVFFKGAYFGIKNGTFGMDMLVCVGATLTYIYSIYASLSKVGESYFESVAMIITIVFVGKFLEVKSKKNAGDALDKLNSTIPSNVIVLEGENRICKTPQEVKVGDRIEILPGESLALDGILESKEALLDTKAINGESLPSVFLQGKEIFSGYVNTNKSFIYKVCRPFADSLMTRLIRLMEECIAHKPRIQNLANSLSQYFSKIVLGIAMATFLGWYYWIDGTFEHSLMIAISVIVISCPCALALATPIATIVGITEAYKKSLIFKEASFLETMAKADVVLLDKTGTITSGKPEVIEMQKFEEFDKGLLCSFVSASSHPISQSVKKFLGEAKGVINDFAQISSMGIEATSGSKRLLGGNLEYLKMHNVDVSAIDKVGEDMIFAYSVDGKLSALFLLRDTLKKDTKQFINKLKNKGLEIRLLSGDRTEVVTCIAKEAGISNFDHSLMPEDKAKIVDQYHHQGKVVIMVGDGINDALALSKSDIGISMGSGSDIALASSDVVVLDDTLTSLGSAFDIATLTYKTIKQNIFLSVIYNLLMIPLAVLGFIIPLFAALSMSLSSLLVVGNSFRIRK